MGTVYFLDGDGWQQGSRVASIADLSNLLVPFSDETRTVRIVISGGYTGLSRTHWHNLALEECCTSSVHDFGAPKLGLAVVRPARWLTVEVISQGYLASEEANVVCALIGTAV